ncbi:MAG TPA: hypothetical protein VIV12_01485 [Streptosporangiaceae bacterium]
MTGWLGWPSTVRALAALTRGIVDLERAAALPNVGAVVVDLDGLRAVIAILTWRG